MGSRHKGYGGEGWDVGEGGLDWGGEGGGGRHSQDLYSLHIKQREGRPLKEERRVGLQTSTERYLS